MRGHGETKFTTSTLLASSAQRDWPMLAVELRRHQAGAIAPFITGSTELTLILRAVDPSTVSRAAHGVRQSAPAIPGTTFMIPAGTTEEATYLTGDIAEVMHLYLSDTLFDSIADEEDIPRFHQRDIRYVSGVHDPSLAWLARRLARELTNESAGAQALVETLGLCLADRLVRNYTEGVARPRPAPRPVAGLSGVRLRRVLEYIAANLDMPVTVRAMAAVACLSPFHFARAFHVATGRPPHRYLSEQRLALAKRLLRQSDCRIADIAESCSFSSQASFTRAFSAAVGQSPAMYRTQA